VRGFVRQPGTHKLMKFQRLSNSIRILRKESKRTMIITESGLWKRRQPKVLNAYTACQDLLVALGSICRRQVEPVLCLLLLSAVSFAQQQPSNLDATHERALLAFRFTSQKLWIWQNRLNLKDWNISIILSPATDLKPDTLGHIHWDRDTKTAVIQVLDPADYHLPQNEMLQDMEFTIVHELIHLNFGPVLSDFRRSEANRREEEQAVNHMADALLKLDRNRLVQSVQ
jgi:hypothetical protein